MTLFQKVKKAEAVEAALIERIKTLAMHEQQQLLEKLITPVENGGHAEQTSFCDYCGGECEDIKLVDDLRYTHQRAACGECRKEKENQAYIY